MTGKGDSKRVVFVPVLFPFPRSKKLEISIEQIKEHLKEYVSPSKASNNCLIQFSPVTYKEGHIHFVQQNSVLQSAPTWLLPTPSKEVYDPQKCQNRWLPTQTPFVRPCHVFPLVPYLSLSDSKIKTSSVYSIANTSEEKSVWMQQSTHTQSPQWIADSILHRPDGQVKFFWKKIWENSNKRSTCTIVL